MKYPLFFLLIMLVCSCRSATERWLNSMPDYKEVRSGNLSFQMLRMKNAGDTTALNCRVRITPSANYSLNPVDFYYKMDSCFYLKAGTKIFKPTIVEAVPNGIKGCFEYLLSFDISQPMKLMPVQLVYQDKYIDGKPYIILLNKQ